MSPGQADSPGTVSLLTHTRADQTSEAVRQAVQAAAKAGVRLVASMAEVEKHGDAATGVEGVEDPETAADLCLVLGGDDPSCKRCARTPAPAFPSSRSTSARSGSSRPLSVTRRARRSRVSSAVTSR